MNLHIYGCGGCGINQVAKFASKDLQAKVTYIDTSRSNLTEDMAKENIFLVPDVDGSGKNQRANAPAIRALMPEIIMKHAPAEFNIVVFGAAGGTGSVAGPLLIEQLIAKGLPTIAIVTGTSESGITTTNTLNTLRNLARFSEENKMPIAMVYEDNMTEKSSRQSVDTNVLAQLDSLYLIIGSESNRELDRADLTNWLHYHMVTRVPYGLVELQMFNSSEALEASGIRPVSMVSLLCDETRNIPAVLPDYNATGYNALLQDIGNGELHAVLVPETVADLSKFVMSRVDKVKQAQTTRRPTEVAFETLGDDESYNF